MRMLLVLLVSLTGCSLYWHGDDDCNYADDYAPAFELRDPQTGQCEGFGGGGNCYCGPCPETAGADIPAPPQWPMCFGSCSALSEQACLTTSTCHAAYTVDPNTNMAPVFWGCWDTQTQVGLPAHSTGACISLDATSCIFRDDCSSFYNAVGGAQAFSGNFTFCEDEAKATTCTGVDCGPGAHCEQQCQACDSQMCNCQAFCVPDLGCQGVDCGPGFTCVESCDSTGACGTCQATCVPTTTCEALNTEADCKARTDCEPIYMGDNCTCTPTTCTCETETYERCQSL
jgi:hypothetical protein